MRDLWCANEIDPEFAAEAKRGQILTGKQQANS